GGRLAIATTALDSGPVEVQAGDLEAAERELRRGYDILEAMGERAYLSTVAAFLARVAEARGRLDDADRLSHLSEASAAPDDVETQVLWRGALARAMARRGAYDEAEALARAAVSLLDGIDGPWMRGTAELDLAVVLAAAGRAAEAEEAAERAAALFAA